MPKIEKRCLNFNALPSPKHTLRHLAWHVATCQASHTGLESGGKLWGWAGEGQSQGDPEASALFTVQCGLAPGSQRA